MNLDLVDLTVRGRELYTVDSVEVGMELEKAPTTVYVALPHPKGTWTFHYTGVLKDSDEVPIGYKYADSMGRQLHIYE